MSKKATIIGIISALLLGVMVPLSVGIVDGFINPSSSEPIEEFEPLAPEFLEKPNDGTLPKDHSLYDNYRIAGGVLSLTENFRTVQEGNAISDMIIENNQVVYAERVVNGDLSYATYLTTSNFVNKTNQRMYLEDKVLFREGKVESRKAIYSEDVAPYSYSYDYIYENLGWVPREMSPYVITEDNIVSSRVIEESNYPYTMEFILDNKESVDHTKREVRYNADALSYPKYSQVKVTISLDNDWKVLEIQTDDIYDITVKMGISMTVPVNSKLVEKFYYDDYLISSLDSYSYFSNYFDFEINDDVEITVEKTALDYILDVAFDVILNGSSFNVNGNILNSSINGKIDVKFDFLNMSGNVIGLFDDLYFKYDGDLYLSYLKHNYKFDKNFIEYILNISNQGLVETATINDSYTIEEDDEMLNDFVEELELVKDGNKVKVSGNYEEVNFAFNFFEIEQGVLLRSIELDGRFENQDFNLQLTTTSNNIEYEENEYNDLSSSTWLIDECLEIIDYKGYSLCLNYQLELYNLEIEINVKDNAVLVVYNITNEDNEKITIDLFCIDEKYYLELDNYIIEVEQEDINLLFEYLESYLQVDEEEIENNYSQESSQVEIENQDVLDLVFDVIDEIHMIDSEHMNVRLLLTKIDEKLSDTNVILSLENDNLNLYIDAYKIDMSIYEYCDTISLPVGKEIYNKDVVNTITTHYKNIESLLKKETIQIDINDVIIQNSEGSIYVDGEYTKNNSDYCLELQFTNLVKMKFKIVFLNSKYYLSLGQDSYTVNLILNEKQMETFVNYLDKVMDYILGENDFDVSMETFIAEFIDELMKILSGESLDIALGDFIYYLSNALDSSYVEIDERNIVLEFDTSKLQLYKLGDNYMLMVEGIEYKESKVQGDITFKEREYIISVDSSSFIDISTIFEDLGIEN